MVHKVIPNSIMILISEHRDQNMFIKGGRIHFKFVTVL